MIIVIEYLFSASRGYCLCVGIYGFNRAVDPLGMIGIRKYLLFPRNYIWGYTGILKLDEGFFLW